MALNAIRALVATADTAWRDRCASTLMNEGCNVDTASAGVEALDLVQKLRFHVVLLDDTLEDYGTIELSLTIRDMAHGDPYILVGGDDVGQFEHFWARFRAFYAGDKDGLPQAALEAVRRASDA